MGASQTLDPLHLLLGIGVLKLLIGCAGLAGLVVLTALLGWHERPLAALTRWRWRTYRDYLRSWVWRSKRARAIRRADHACQLCNTHGRLEVHHREYPQHFGEEPDDDLTVLCRACHGAFHAKRRLSR